jgi:transcriptional regulator with PAS, ATPase and Fis domain
VEKHRRRMGKRVEGISDEALDALCRYEWPGNVRELENAIERAVVLTRAPVIGLGDISFTPVATSRESTLPSQNLRDNVEWAERESIHRALARAKGVKKKAAESLGVSQRALSYYLKKFRIE